MSDIKTNNGNIGILVSGGPAPGINSVIASVVFNATKAGYKIKGFSQGLKGIINNGTDSIIDLTPSDVIPIQKKGGSILRTIRFNPFKNEEYKGIFFKVLKEANINKLVMIGGDGTASLAYLISKKSDIQVIHIPKTIDNDLILPNQHPSFGFETARYIGTKLISTLMTESKTTERWFIVKTMGRNAGFLSLGLGIASGATLTIIPEQFSKGITPDDVADVILSSIKRRHASGKNYGTVILAEGITDLFDPEAVSALKNSAKDPLGRTIFADIPLQDLIVNALDAKVKQEDDLLDVRLKAEDLGYVMRCADPVSFDVEYTRFLGYGAVKFMKEGRSGVTVVKNYDKLDCVNLEQMTDSKGNIISRKVDLESDLYEIACSFMFK